MTQFQIKYADTTIDSNKRCFNCGEHIGIIDGPKYISIKIFSEIDFHAEECYDYFLMALMEFTRIFIKEKNGHERIIH
jgi:hypothetical protein